MKFTRWGIVSLVVMATVVLSGCSPAVQKGKDPKMDYPQAQAELARLYAMAQDAVGGTWKPMEFGADSCALPSGARGAQTGGGSDGPGVPLEQQRAIIDQVVAAWTRAGFKPFVSARPPVKSIVATQVRYPASGYGVDGFTLSFEIATTASTVDGQTRCVPGDADAINTEYQRLHPQPTLLPGP
jgi:hypothetical protein